MCSLPARVSSGSRQADTWSASTWMLRSGSPKLAATISPGFQNYCQPRRLVWWRPWLVTPGRLQDPDRRPMMSEELPYWGAHHDLSPGRTCST